MNKWVYRFCFVIIIFLAFIGTIFISVIFHELSHRQDLEMYSDGDGTLCFFSAPENITLKEILFGEYIAGYYIHKYKSGISEETKSLLEISSERKAIIVSIVILSIFAISFLIEVKRRRESKEAEEFYDYFNEWLDKENKQNI